MKKKIGLIILVLAALLLNACTLSQSTPEPSPTPTKKGGKPALATPVIDLTSGMLDAAKTGTAAALAGIPLNGTPLVVDATPTGGIGDLGQPTLDPNSALPSPTTNPLVVTTPVPPSGGQTNRPATYTLKKGEFPYCIARRFNVEPNELLALNGLSMQESESLPPGTVLKIPTSSNVFPPPRALKAHPATYVVQGDDTIYSIACFYGDVDPMSIAAANNLAAPYTLTVGASLQIP